MISPKCDEIYIYMEYFELGCTNVIIDYGALYGKIDLIELEEVYDSNLYKFSIMNSTLKYSDGFDSKIKNPLIVEKQNL